MKVRCRNVISLFKSSESWFRQNSYGALSILCINSFDFCMMVVRFPHEKIAEKNPAISISCFLLNKCGILMGSFEIKEGRLYSLTFLSRNSFSLSVSIDEFLTEQMADPVLRARHFLNQLSASGHRLNPPHLRYQHSIV